MAVLQMAWQDLRRHQGLVFAYMGAHFVIMLCFAFLDRYLHSFRPEQGAAPMWLAFAQLGRQFVLATAIAATQAILLSFLGRAIDRPLWKCKDAAEALRRFFMLWFIINLIAMLFSQLADQALRQGNPDLAIALQQLLLFYPMIYVPLGACAMYWGRFEWAELGEALKPITRHFSKTAVVFLILLAQTMVTVILSVLLAGDRESPAAIVELAVGGAFLSFIELLAFAVMWRICMVHRDTAFGGEDDDNFDF